MSTAAADMILYGEPPPLPTDWLGGSVSVEQLRSLDYGAGDAAANQAVGGLAVQLITACRSESLPDRALSELAWARLVEIYRERIGNSRVMDLAVRERLWDQVEMVLGRSRPATW